MQDRQIRDMEAQSNEKLLTPVRIFYTASVMFIGLTYGISTTILGPSLVDLSYIYDVKIEKASNAPLMVSIGYVFGAFIAGQAPRWYQNRQILLSCLLFPMGLAPFFFLYIQPFEVALVFYFLFGLGPGAIDSMLSVWIIDLWPKHNSIVLPLSVTLFGIGQITGPTMMSAFVKGKVNDTSIVTSEHRKEALIIPFSITGILVLLMPILYVIFNFTKYHMNSAISSETSKKIEVKTDSRITNNPARTYHLILAGIGIAAYGGAETGWNAFSASMFQHLGVDFIDASEAALIQALWSTAFALGMFCSVLMAIKMTPDSIILGHFIIVFSSLILLYIKSDVKVCVYIATIAFGWGMSALWAMKYAFIEKYLMLTDKIASIYTIMFGVFGIIVPIVMGNTEQEENPKILLIVVITFLGISALSFTFLKLWLIHVNKRYAPQEHLTSKSQ